MAEKTEKTGLTFIKIRKGTAALLAGLLFALTQTGPLARAAVPCAIEKYTAGEDSAANVDTTVNTAGAATEEKGKEPFRLNAQSAVLMDAKTGRILYGKDIETQRPMASTTKIMTCILALEQGNPEDLVEVSAYAASMPDVQLNIREGEKYKLKDLLYSLMLESHNDSAVAVAEHIGGSVEGFAAMMNQKARDIGCTDTCFVTPNGLDASSKENGTPHSTTAADLAQIMRYCVLQSPKREEFLEITRTASRSITDEAGKRSFYLGNHNALLTMMPEALSGKTGFTGGAGYCYVAALEKDGKEFTVALLGCGWPPHKTYKWEDMRKLVRYAFEEYDYYEIFEKNKTFPSLKIIDGMKDEVSLKLGVPEDGQSLKILLKEGEQPDIRYEYPKEMKAPVEAGMAVGTVTYSLGGEQIAAYPICAAEGAERIDFKWCLRRCLEHFLPG